MDSYNSFPSNFNDIFSIQKIGDYNNFQNDFFSKPSNYDQDYFPMEKVKNESIFQFGINDSIEKNNPFNITFAEKSTDFISKINNSSEKLNEIKDNKKIEENSFNQFKEKNQNLTGKKTKRNDIEKKNFGRKKKDSDEKGSHTKNNDDNIITKIKIILINSILDLLNKSFIYFNPDPKPFLKSALEKNKYKSIKKDINLKLLKTKIKDIFNNEISSKYTIKDINSNKILIKKIYEEEKETNIIKILELTFGDFLNIFRETISTELQEKISHIEKINENFRCLPYYLNKIMEEKSNRESEGNMKSYIDKIKYLSINFEKWFYKKSEKKSKSNNEKNIIVLI